MKFVLRCSRCYVALVPAKQTDDSPGLSVEFAVDADASRGPCIDPADGAVWDAHPTIYVEATGRYAPSEATITVRP